MDDFCDNKLIFLYSRVYALRQYDAGASLRTWFQRIQQLRNTKTRYLENRITKLRNYEITNLRNYKIAKLHSIKQCCNEYRDLSRRYVKRERRGIHSLRFTRKNHNYLNARNKFHLFAADRGGCLGKLIFTFLGTPIYEGIALSLAY